MKNEPIYICCVKNNHALPGDIIENLQKVHAPGIEVIDSEITVFKNGELKPRLLDSIRGKHIWLISTQEEDINTETIKTLAYLDALQRHGAVSTSLLQPFYYYARQDKTGGNREPVTGRMLADFYENRGVNHFVTVHLHNDAIQGFFNKQVDMIGTKKIFWNKLEAFCRERDGYFDQQEWLIVPADEGGAKQCRDFAEKTGAGFNAILSKYRKEANQVSAMNFSGDVTDKRCYVFEDMIDTGGTLAKAGEILMEHGAREVFAGATHPLLNGEAPKLLEASPFSKIFVTDSLYIPDHKIFSKMENVSLAEMLAEVIRKAHCGESIRYENW